MSYTNLLVDDYYNWLLEIIEDADHPVKNYTDVLDVLFKKEFYSIVANDQNRIEDGFDLRNKFAEEIGEHVYFVMDELPDYCSVLEMMIGLACRMECDISYDADLGDRSYKWFWIMMQNLGLSNMTNDVFDVHKTNRILDRFLARLYSKSGHGGLFVVKNPNIDMRKEEIWYQMNYFFDEYFDDFS